MKINILLLILFFLASASVQDNPAKTFLSPPTFQNDLFQRDELPVPFYTSDSPGWQCRNDLEISCSSGNCEAKTKEDFTPMSVSFDEKGAISVCAYTGCWEGTAKVSKRENFLILTGHDLKFSTAPESAEMRENIIIALDRTDNIAFLKAGAFAQPLICERKIVDKKNGR